MEPNETLTVPAVQDAGVEPPSTETQPPAQAPAEPQETATNPEVEVGSKVPQEPEPPRRKPSDYYRERETIRSLKEQIALQNQRFDELTSLLKKKDEPGTPEAVDFDPAHFSPEHKRILLAREKALRDEIATLKSEFSGWQKSKAEEENNRKMQGALEKLFPKSSPDSTESLQERMAKDPERTDQIRELLISSGLNELAKVNPDLAVEVVLQKMGSPTPNPTVLPKSLMGGVKTGNPSGGNKPDPEANLLAENKKIDAQLEANQALRFDEKFMARRRQVIDELARLMKEKRG